jgi:hypothetical protein
VADGRGRRRHPRWPLLAKLSLLRRDKPVAVRGDWSLFLEVRARLHVVCWSWRDGLLVPELLRVGQWQVSEVRLVHRASRLS